MQSRFSRVRAAKPRTSFREGITSSSWVPSSRRFRLRRPRVPSAACPFKRLDDGSQCRHERLAARFRKRIEHARIDTARDRLCGLKRLSAVVGQSQLVGPCVGPTAPPLKQSASSPALHHSAMVLRSIPVCSVMSAWLAPSRSATTTSTASCRGVTPSADRVVEDQLGALTGPVQQVNGRSAHPIAGIGHCVYRGISRNDPHYLCMPNVSNDMSGTRFVAHIDLFHALPVHSALAPAARYPSHGEGVA